MQALETLVQEAKSLAAGGPRVRVDITAGPEDPHGTVDETVKLYIKAMVTHWVDNPSASGSTTPAPAASERSCQSTRRQASQRAGATSCSTTHRNSARITTMVTTIPTTTIAPAHA